MILTDISSISSEVAGGHNLLDFKEIIYSREKKQKMRIDNLYPKPSNILLIDRQMDRYTGRHPIR